MEMKKCQNGHFYDASINATCPYCDGNAGGAMSLEGMGMAETGKTLPVGMMAELGGSMAQPQAFETGKTLPVGGVGSLYGSGEIGGDDGRTVAVIKQSMGIDPVVGWLVCVSGKEKGRDYRIHSDNNFIGRSERMDICIRGDETISRENHAIISYDSQDKIFYFSPGDGRSIVRYNGKAIFQTVELKNHDRILIGKTELIFVPLCDAAFNWMENEDAAE